MINFRVFFLSLFSVLFLTFSTANAQQSPEEFVVSLMKEANNLSKLSEDLREQALLNLIRHGFDIPLIGKFVLGRYWRKMTYKQKNDFLDVFEMAAVRSFSPLLKGISLDTFKIIRVQDADILNVLVFSTIRPKKNEVINLRWRLLAVRTHQYDGHRIVDMYKVIDITAEGISLVVTLRSEYTTFIKRNGGIDNLIVKLRKKANEKR